ncbi:MAG: hypothetical protein FWC40_04345, partial [Proteobacteria bacterium]|nr:hypothetical protein [Pseudomonadota bacterium]
GTDAPGRLPAAASNEARALRVVSEAASPPPMALMMEALEEGFMPTQQVGEMGSLQGVLDTIYPMVYAETKYERLPGSPLIRFTDDMIWQSGDSYYVKRDAMEDQARHIQEASIALSVSPRIEMGQTTGYRLVEIPPDTLFSKIGMVSGDIILTINGTKPDMEPMALMFVNMVAGTHGMSTIQVEHRGVKRTLTIRASE